MKRQIHELTSQHNKLTLLCKMLYSNIKSLSTEVRNLRGGNVVQRQNVQQQQVHQQRSQVPQHQPQIPMTANHRASKPARNTSFLASVFPNDEFFDH